MDHGQNGDQIEKYLSKMKYFNAGNVSVTIAILMIVYSLISHFIH